MSLAASHGLLEMEHGLGRSTSKTRDPFAHQILHPLGDVSAFEERSTIALAFDQFVKPLDLVAECDRERIGLKFADVSNGLH